MRTVLMMKSTLFRHLSTFTGAFFIALFLMGGCFGPQEPDSKWPIRDALNLYYEGERLLLDGDLAGARERFERSLEISPRPRVRWRLAQLFIELQEYDLAREQLNAALETNPHFNQVTDTMSQMEAKITVQGSEAKPSTAESAIAESTLPVRIPIIALSGGPVSDPGRSITAATATQPIAPTPTPIPANLTPEQIAKINQLVAEGKHLQASGAVDDAIQRYRDALEIDPGRADLYYQIGTIYLNTKQPERALIELRQAVQYNPQLADAYNNLGVTYEHLGQIEPAVDAYRKATDIGTNNDAYYNLGVILEKIGEWEESIQAYREYFKRDSSSEWGQKAKTRMEALERTLY